jgi:hypothetical protein
MTCDEKLPFLAGNLAILKGQHAAIHRWLAAHEARAKEQTSRLFRNGQGLKDWQLPSGQGLFDSISPKSVYRSWSVDERPPISATLIVGSNLGYGINHVLAHTASSHRVLVLEPRPEMLLACLGQTDYRPFLQDKRLLFVPPDAEYFARVAWRLDVEYVFGKVFVLADLPSYQLGPEYAVWVERVRDILDRVRVDINTLRAQQDTMVRNELANFARAMKDGNLLPLRNKAGGLKAVVYGAGPSLGRFGPLMAKHPGSALHVCGLQTLPALYSFGLKPHFCMAIDYTKAMKDVCDGLDKRWAKDIPLIYSCKVSPETVEAYPGPTIPIWTAGGLGTCMPRRREFVLNGGGSIGVAMTRFLSWCGVSRILLAGFDFAWPGDKTHVAGHFAAKRSFRFDPRRHMTMKNKDGDTIYSDLAYVTALRDLEDDVRRTSTSIFNLYGGGARIRGAREVSWEEVEREGVLASEGGSLEHFSELLRHVRRPRTWPHFEARGLEWSSSLEAVVKRLCALFKKRDKCEGEIHTVFSQILYFLQQDGLYRPYLFNEILDMTRLVRHCTPYGRKDLSECKRILKQVQEKVREIDGYLVYARKEAA